MEELGRLTQIGGHGGVAYLLEKVGEELEQRHVRLRPLRHRDSLVFFLPETLDFWVEFAPCSSLPPPRLSLVLPGTGWGFARAGSAAGSLALRDS